MKYLYFSWRKPRNMADYYPLISRLVAGLGNRTGDARQSLYERARAALLVQLRTNEPPLSEPDKARERVALEQAIQRAEAEMVLKQRIASRGSEILTQPIPNASGARSGPSDLPRSEARVVVGNATHWTRWRRRSGSCRPSADG